MQELVMVPGPTNVPERVMRAMLKPIIDHRSPDFRDVYESISENLRYLFQTEGDVFVVSASGTGGVECAVGNSVSPGDRVLVPVFGLFSERLREAVVRRGGKPVDLPVRWGSAPSAERIREIVEGEKDLKAVAIVYNETSTGVKVKDLPKIGEICKEKGILLIVDAVSVLGGDELPVDKWNIDICVAASQKCIACPPGLAPISVSEKAWSIIERVERPFYFDLVEMRKFSERKETPFTPALPLFYALDEALKLLREEGLENRFRRHKVCGEAFYAAVEALGLKPFPDHEVRSNTVIAFHKPQNIDNHEVRELMREKYGVMIAGGAGKLRDEIFRIGCMGTVSEAEVLLTINALENALAAQGYSFRRGSGIEAALGKLESLRSARHSKS
ncbi:MAG: alanine--glyoxylate aminotransferase family protein [Nitrososphaerota archaeon]|nr:alanine--glyoxylate aminotransferase family protein [Nitrososphaerota archaeon]